MREERVLPRPIIDEAATPTPPNHHQAGAWVPAYRMVGGAQGLGGGRQAGAPRFLMRNAPPSTGGPGFFRPLSLLPTHQQHAASPVSPPGPDTTRPLSVVRRPTTHLHWKRVAGSGGRVRERHVRPGEAGKKKRARARALVVQLGGPGRGLGKGGRPMVT